jgi:Fe-S cluster assembly protein SufB
MSKDNQVLEELTSKEYEHGWTTNIETESAPKGLNEDIIRFISAKKNEPQWLLDYRLNAYRQWTKMKEPKWPNVTYPPINYQDIIYYSAPVQKAKPKNLEDVDPELIKTFEKLGISLTEQKRLTGIAVDAVIDSVSVATTFKETLGELGIIFCSFSEAVQEHPELGSVYGWIVLLYS